jgi:hypothetical protein
MAHGIAGVWGLHNCHAAFNDRQFRGVGGRNLFCDGHDPVRYWRQYGDSSDLDCLYGPDFRFLELAPTGESAPIESASSDKPAAAATGHFGYAGAHSQSISSHFSCSSGIESSQPDSQPVGFDHISGELDCI